MAAPQHMAQRHAFGIVTVLVCVLVAVAFAVPPVTEHVTIPVAQFLDGVL